MRRVVGVLALLACLAAPSAASAAGDPFAGTGVWVWQMSRTEGGDADAVAARAATSGVSTVIVKGGNATTRWGQFSPALVAALHARGLNACAYHFLYGRKPVAEAALTARLVAAGAACRGRAPQGPCAGRYPAPPASLA